jgi:hypothetical protein
MTFTACAYGIQVGKLKSLCESFFKLKDIKVRLFVEEEV